MPNFETVANTCRDRFNTNVGVPESIYVHYDNAEFLDPGVTKFIRFKVLFGASSQVQAGTPNTYRTIGVCLAQIFIPPHIGDREALRLADVIVPFFRCVTVSGVTFRTPSVEPIGRWDNWWQIAVKCPFFVDENA